MSLLIVLLLALALLAPGTALAAEETSGYTQTPTTPTTPTTTTTTTTTPATTPTTTPTTTTTPSTGTSPSKEEGAPTTTTAKEPEPTTSAAPAKEAKTLPFTGFDLRWSFAIGLALMIAGFSIIGVQRRRRSER